MVEYNSLVMMIYAKGESITVDDVEALLLMQDAQFDKFRQELPSPSISVNVAQASGFQESSSTGDFDRNRGGSNGNFCGRGGPKSTCQLCDKYGHDAFHCWYRFDQSFTPAQGPPSQSQPSHGSYQNHQNRQGSYPNQQNQAPQQQQSFNQQQSAHLVMQQPQFVPNTQELLHKTFDAQTQFPDSGASHHITADPNNLTQSNPFGGHEQVLMGNG